VKARQSPSAAGPARRADVTSSLLCTALLAGVGRRQGISTHQSAVTTLHLTDNNHHKLAVHANNTHHRLNTATSANMALKRINKVRRRRHERPPFEQVQPR